jgi:hypothetical protein
MLYLFEFIIGIISAAIIIGISLLIGKEIIECSKNSMIRNITKKFFKSDLK